MSERCSQVCKDSAKVAASKDGRAALHHDIALHTHDLAGFDLDEMGRVHRGERMAWIVRAWWFVA